MQVNLQPRYFEESQHGTVQRRFSLTLTKKQQISSVRKEDLRYEWLRLPIQTFCFYIVFVSTKM